jgi:hypothetical protein
MNANEARKIADNVLTMDSGVVMNLIYGEIKKAAEDGGDFVGIEVTPRMGKVMEQILKRLRGEGYKVEHNHGSDQRDDSSWNYMIIRW